MTGRRDVDTGKDSVMMDWTASATSLLSRRNYDQQLAGYVSRYAANEQETESFREL